MTEELVRFEGSLPSTQHPVIGPVDPFERIEFTVKLRRANGDGLPTLDEFVKGERAKGVDRRALLDRYGSSRDDADSVARWALDQDLSVIRTDLGYRQVRLVGSAAAIERAFAIRLTRHRHRRTGAEFRSHDRDLSVPKSLKDVIVGVLGLDTRQVTVRHAARVGRRQVANDDPKSQFPTTFYPNEVSKLYQFPAATGVGQRVAILEFGGGFDPAELSSYFTSTIGLAKAPTANALFVLDAKMDIGDGATGEVYLDIEVVGGMAPDAVMDVIFAPFTGEGFLAAIELATKNDDYAAISISYGLDEDMVSTPQNPGWDMLNNLVDEGLLEAAHIGVPVFISTGDQGSGSGRGIVMSQGQQIEITYLTPAVHACYPSTNPCATAVGGTMLYAENGAITDEVVWNELGAQIPSVDYYDETGTGQNGVIFVGGATGSGVSDRYPTVPSYQSKAGIALKSANPAANAGRCVPDVAGNAGSSTGYLVTQPPGSQAPILPVGGTSAAAPMWAALMACVRQGLGESLQGAAPTFFINDFLYACGQTDAFRNIVKGRQFSYPPGSNGVAGDFIANGNNCSSQTNGYTTTAGYNLCTGWGAPNGQALLGELANWLKTPPPPPPSA